MERSGMRWTEQMAEATVQLRSVLSLKAILIVTGNSTSTRISSLGLDEFIAWYGQEPNDGVFPQMVRYQSLPQD
jgi:hypothetical protein